MTLSGRRVLIFQQRDWAIRAGSYVAERLRDEGCKLAAITLKATTDEMVRNQSGIEYEKILYTDAFWNDPYTVDGLDDISLTEVCVGLGVDSIWPIANAERHYVRSYAEGYYFSYRQNRSDKDIIAYVKACYLEISRLLDSFKPEIIISLNYAGPIQIITYLLALKRGITDLALYTARVQDLYVLFHDYQCLSGPMTTRFSELNEGRTQSENLERARVYIDEFRTEFKKPNDEDWGDESTPIQMRIKNHLRPLKKILLFYFKRPVNETPDLGPTIDFEPPKIVLRNHFAHELNRWKALRFNYTQLEDVSTFVYFPLQAQPEEQIDVMAPHFNNQIETARLVAQALPDDLTLVVKEHPVMLGRRKVSYYEKLARTPNVKLVHLNIPAESIMRKASAVISTGGTTILEAAIYRLPVIQLGNLGVTLLLPNVRKVTDLTTLSSELKKMLAEVMANPEYDRRLENYVAAAYDVGFPMLYNSTVWTLDDTGRESLWQGYRTEMLRVFNGTESAII